MKRKKRAAAIILAALAFFLITRLLATQCGFLVGVPDNFPRSTFQWLALVVIGVLVLVGGLQSIFYDLISYYLFKRGIESSYDEVHYYTESGNQPIERELKFGCIYPVSILILLVMAWGWAGPAYCT